MTKTKKSFLLHIDSLSILEELDDKQAGMLFRAIAAFHTGESIELDPLVRIAFSSFKNQFLRDDEKYQVTCQRRAEAGAKGGAKSKRPSKAEPEKEDKQNKQLLANDSKPKQTQAKQAESKKDNDNKKDNDSDSKKDNDLNNKPLLAEANTVDQKNMAFQIFNYWCQAMDKSLSSSKLTPKREKAIKARLKEGYTPEQIKAAIDGCKNDPFSMGKNERNKPFNDIELICRTGEKLESFLEAPTENLSGKTGRNISILQDLDLQ